MAKTSLEKINDGLANRQRQRSNPFATATIVSAASLQTLREEFAAHHAAHAKHMKAATDRIAAFDEAQSRDFLKYQHRATVGNGGALVNERRSNAELAQFRENQKRDRVAAVNAIAADAKAVCQPNQLKMQEIAAAIRASAGQFSALSLASSHELGSERRSQLFAEVSTMQPMALLHVAQKAASEGNSLLASVCISVCDAMPADRRPFVPADLAAQAFGARAASAQEHVTHVTTSHAATLAAEQALTVAPNDALGKIARGVESRIANSDSIAADRRSAAINPPQE